MRPNDCGARGNCGQRNPFIDAATAAPTMSAATMAARPPASANQPSSIAFAYPKPIESANHSGKFGRRSSATGTNAAAGTTNAKLHSVLAASHMILAA